MKAIALITARGGSKGLPQKNIRELAGKPLIAHSIEAAKNCSLISRCLVSTEDAAIKRVSLDWGAEVIDRPAHLATDTALSQDVVRHALETLKSAGEMAEYFVLLQPTSPLRNDRHLTECLERFFQSDFRSCMSVTEVEHHPYKNLRIEDNTLLPFHNIESLDKPRQLLPKVYRQNGAIYVMRSADFLEQRSFFVAPAMPYFMNVSESVDIDSEADFLLATHFLNQYQKV